MKNNRALRMLINADIIFYRRHAKPLWQGIPIIVFLAAMSNNQEGLHSVNLILIYMVAFIFVINEHVIVDPFFNIHDELKSLWIFPLNVEQVVWAKAAATLILLLLWIIASVATAALLFGCSLAMMTDAILYFFSSFVPLFLIGVSPLWPVKTHIDASILIVLAYGLSIGISSLPYVLTKVVMESNLLCLLWIVVSFGGAKYVVIPKSAGWIIERKYRRDDP